MKNKKVIIFSVILLVFVSIIGVKIALNKLVNDVKSIPISTPDMMNIPNGTYIGEYSATPVYVKVEVVVTEHEITDIKILEHQNGLGGKAEKIVDDVINKQLLEVDAVSSATVSSKCIVKAIENALQSESN